MNTTPELDHRPDRMSIEDKNSRIKLFSLTAAREKLTPLINKFPAEQRNDDKPSLLKMKSIVTNHSQAIIDGNLRNKIQPLRKLITSPAKISDHYKNCSEKLSKLDDFLNEWRYNIEKQEAENEYTVNVKNRYHINVIIKFLA